MPFLPKDYKTPSTSNYMKWQDGKNKFRVLSDAIIGWEYWTKDKKPVRSRQAFSETPNIADQDPRFFWAMTVWNYQEERVQILEITQKTIIRAIENLNADSDWGDPRKYDITVTRSGSGMETEYTVTPKDAEMAQKIAEAYKATSINLEALFDGADPFATETELGPNTDKNMAAFAGKNYPKGESTDDIPF